MAIPLGLEEYVDTVSEPVPVAAPVTSESVAVAVPIGFRDVALWELVALAGAGGGSGTTTNEAVPVDPEYPAPAGVNTALSASVPAGRADVEIEATPPLTFWGLPISLPPCSNCTVPVASGGVTVAVRVSEVPASCGLVGAADKVVDVATTGFTVNDSSPLEDA
jgi:hypothetical protein